LRGAAGALAQAIGYLPDPDARAIYEPHIEAARLNLDQASWDAASAEGGAMPLVKAIEYGLTEQTAPQDASLPRQ
jgi:hypothetical protein